MASSKNRLSPSVPTSSLADIAFLLLIFFLVVTRIEVEQGIPVKLPPWRPSSIPQPVNERNVLRIQLSGHDELLVEDEVKDVAELRSLTKDFINNRGVLDHYSTSPLAAIIDLEADDNATYQAYLSVYNEIRGAYRELRDEWSESHYGKTAEDLMQSDPEAFERVQSEYPIRISEPETD